MLWRTIFLAALLIAPIAVITGFGAWALWQTGWLIWLWWLLPACWGVAWILARWWRHSLAPLPPPSVEPAAHWTPQDEQAWKLVEHKAGGVANVSQDQLVRIQTYVDAARELALDVARVYHPAAEDVYSRLTIPEIMAAGQLALEDLVELYDDYVPGGHLLTIGQMQSLTKLARRARTVFNVIDTIRILFNPAEAIARKAVKRELLSRVGESLKSNVLAWFYGAFVYRLGQYLIEMNSGRLRGGAKHFRQTFQAQREAARDATTEGAANKTVAKPLTACVAGRTGSGKSSLIAALCGRRFAADDFLAAKDPVRLSLPDGNDELQLLESPGFGADGPSERQFEKLRDELLEADLLLLVFDATIENYAAEAMFLDRVYSNYEDRPHLKPPQIVGVLNRIDRLPPQGEWSPPYDWRNPATEKEQSIAQAMARVTGGLDRFLNLTIPVCAGGGVAEPHGVGEHLVPELSALLAAARNVERVRSAHTESRTGRFSRVLDQVKNIGRGVKDAVRGAGKRR